MTRDDRVSGNFAHGLLLTPGAGAVPGQPHPGGRRTSLVAPLPVRRIDFAYRSAGRRMPGPSRSRRSPPSARNVKPSVLRPVLTQPSLVLGGRSYGGRMCSMAVARGIAGGRAGAAQLSAPPAGPSRCSSAPNTSRDCPCRCLFVSGISDPFGSPAEFDAALGAVPGPVTQVVRLPGGHDVRGRDKEVATAVREWLIEPGLNQDRPQLG